MRIVKKAKEEYRTLGELCFGETFSVKHPANDRESGLFLLINEELDGEPEPNDNLLCLHLGGYYLHRITPRARIIVIPCEVHVL